MMTETQHTTNTTQIWYDMWYELFLPWSRTGVLAHFQCKNASVKSNTNTHYSNDHTSTHAQNEHLLFK